MPQFKVAKTDNINKLNDKQLNEDKLYIYKETNAFGRLFYDFDENTRIEIGSSDNIYHCVDKLNNDVEIIDINKLRKYLASDELSIVNVDEIQINSLVTNFKSLYNIRDIKKINNENNTKVEITLRKIYTQQDLTWNDYY